MRLRHFMLCVLALAVVFHLPGSFTKKEAQTETASNRPLPGAVAGTVQQANPPKETVPAHPPVAARDIGEYDAADPFAPKAWFVPPPPAPAAPPAAVAPAAPPLPFRLVGTLEAEPKRIVFYLAKGEQEFPVTVGETFDGEYRLDAAELHQLVFTYLPMQVTQTLPITEQ